ncbi:hypothetical protein M407DRAFT_24108 [Tulasnella calospora MUT 4182]|uniref:SAP domain-containing protein n=1 Tax=Tulasnella calospora MUT 4182 TaxID=1051891 RepID=A0A0C3QK33_9AGAM|nr:hypothetical protein M407DRAFT_24108 [Tulasnella calospora MUT 4182]
MSSNEILFNSAALHSLKRAQLVKICKRHGLKASGKNAELIQRLEEYAKNLSDDSAIPGAFDVPTSDAPGDDDDEENEDEDDNASTTTKTPSRNLGTVSTRPSEPWSVLDEDDEPKGLFPTVNSQQTGKTTIAITTTGLAEFGTETQPEPKSSSVGSSLRAFATSLKRVATIGSSSSLKSKSSSQDVQNPEPAPTSAPARSSPSPSPEPPVPQPTTYCPDPSLASSTIRLIPSSSSTNLLSKAGESTSSDSGTKNDTSDSNEFMVPTKFDDDSSCDEDFGTEDPSQKRKSSLYPELPEFARITAAASAANLLPGGFPSVGFSNFSFAAAPTSPTTDDQPAPTTGAPVPPGVPNTTMAASIMEEMNRQMGIDPNSSAAIGFGIFEKKPTLPSTTIAPPKGEERFNKAHDGLFDKMDSIANHYAARRNPSKARKPVSRNSTTSKPRSSLSATPSAAKRRSKANEAGKRASRSSLVVANEKRLFSPPPAGSSVPQDDVPMEADETDESFAHVGFVTGGDGKKRVTICSPEDDEEDDKDQAMPGGFFDGPSTSKPATPRPSKQVKVVNATPAEKRKLNQAKAKRRSSAARASMGRASIVGAAAVKQVAPQPAKTGGKFGFLKSGAKLVKSLWAGSKATTAAKPAPVAPAAAKEKSRVWGYGGGPAADKGKAKATVGTTASTAAGAKSPPPSTAAVQKLTSPALAVPTTAPANPAAPKTTAATGARTSNPGLAPRPDGGLPKRRIVSGGSSAGTRKSSSVSTTGIGFRSITTARPPVPPPMGVSPIGSSRTRPSSLATGKAAASTSNPARNSSAGPAGKKSSVPPSKSAAGSNFGFDLDRARSPPGPGVKKPSTLTMPTAASLAKMQSNVKPPANENQSVKSPCAPSFHNFGFKGSPARSSNVATAAAGATSPKVAMRSGIPSPFKMPSTLGAITNTVAKTDGDGDQAMADDQDDDFNVPPSKSAASTVNTISSSVSGASVRSSRSLGKRPKIERAKVMARLEEKRAAAAAAATATTSSGAAGSRSSVIGLPAAIRDPTLAQANIRRSHGTAALAGTPTRRRKDIELAVQLSAKKASIRKSEVAAKARMSQTSDVSMSSIYGGVEM